MPAALAVAYLLVLQSVLGALAFGSGPAVSQLDAFGNVICTHEGAAGRPAGDPQQHQHDCCLLGCNLTAFAHGAPPASEAFIHVARYEQLSPLVPVSDLPVVGRERTSSKPRAPPVPA